MSARRRRPRKGSGRLRPGPILLVGIGVAVAIAVVFLVPRLRHGPQPTRPEPQRIPPSTTELLARLSEVMHGEAEWTREGTGSPPQWQGRLRGEESLVRWNARITGAVEAAGLQVLQGTEELSDRRGRWPVQRLTLRIGTDGNALATVVVETARSPALPPAF